MAEGDVVVKVNSLKKYFELRRGFFSFTRERVYVKAVDDVNFEIHEGEILGLVGESGCGKTTTGRLLTRLESPTGGNVFFLGRDIALLEGEDLKVFRRNIQMVFQDPYESLNPRTTVLQTVMEPLINHHIGKTHDERVRLVIKALEDSGLAPAKEYLDRFPHELSGGQRQRVSIARALAINPRVIVADEPVSMLDVSIRAGVLNLMLDLRDKYHIPYLFITHDIAVARYVSDRLAVMYLGRVVELGGTDEVIFNPKHPYTRALLSAVPVPDPEHKHGRITIKGEIPSATNIPLGCRFRTRCPFAFNECGWEGKDMAAFLMDQEKVGAAGHPLSSHVGEVEPDGFSLMVKVKEGGSAARIKEFIDRKMVELRDKSPMFQAVVSVGELVADRQMELSTSAVTVPGTEVAKEFLERLNDTVDFRSRGHPMYGIILDAVQKGNTVELTVGPEAPKTEEGPAERTKVETTIGFIRDFVKHYRKSGYSEFKGVAEIQGPSEKEGAQAGGGSPGRVVVRCRDTSMSARRVADETAEMVTRDFSQNPKSAFFNRLLPVKPGKSGLTIKVMGAQGEWDRLSSALTKYFSDMSAAGNLAAKGVKGIRVTQLKGPSQGVAVMFRNVVEPPLMDVGGGHRVACYLFKPVAQ